MLDPDLAASLLKVGNERIHQNCVLGLPAYQVEVAWRLLIALVMRFEPAGPQAGLIASKVSGVSMWRTGRGFFVGMSSGTLLLLHRTYALHDPSTPQGICKSTLCRTYLGLWPELAA